MGVPLRLCFFAVSGLGEFLLRHTDTTAKAQRRKEFFFRTSATSAASAVKRFYALAPASIWNGSSAEPP